MVILLNAAKVREKQLENIYGNMRKVSLKTGLKGFLVHKSFKAKDISDAVKTNGFESVKDWLKKLLWKYC